MGARKGPPLPGHHCPRPTHQYTTAASSQQYTRGTPLHQCTSTPLHLYTTAASSSQQYTRCTPLHHYASAQLHHCTSTPPHQCTTAASSEQYIRGEQLHWCSLIKLPHSSAVRGNVLHSYTTTTTDIHGGVLIHGALMYLPPFILTTPQPLLSADIHLQAKYRAVSGVVQCSRQ